METINSIHNIDIFLNRSSLQLIEEIRTDRSLTQTHKTALIKQEKIIREITKIYYETQLSIANKEDIRRGVDIALTDLMRLPQPFDLERSSKGIDRLVDLFRPSYQTSKSEIPPLVRLRSWILLEFRFFDLPGEKRDLSTLLLLIREGNELQVLRRTAMGG